jgi:hypothetical protein
MVAGRIIFSKKSLKYCNGVLKYFTVFAQVKLQKNKIYYPNILVQTTVKKLGYGMGKPAGVRTCTWTPTHRLPVPLTHGFWPSWVTGFQQVTGTTMGTTNKIVTTRQKKILPNQKNATLDAG